LNKQPLVCICIPNYNNESTIKETLDSLVHQTYKNIIIKVFDNASTDNSINILKEYELKYNNIKIFQNEKHLVSAEENFNVCIENLEGDFGALYHSDDIYEPTIVEEQVEFFLKNQECVAVSTDLNLIDEYSRRLFKITFKNRFRTEKDYIIINNQLEMLKNILKVGNFIMCPSVMIKTEIYKNKIKRYRFERFKTASDFDLWFRVCEYGKFGVILKPLMNYRQALSSYSFGNRMDTQISDGTYVLEYYYKKFEKSLTKFYKRKYKMYLLAEKNHLSINQILLDKRDVKYDINIFDFEILLEAISSKKNFKTLIKACVVKILRNFGLPKYLRDKLLNLKYKQRYDI